MQNEKAKKIISKLRRICLSENISIECYVLVDNLDIDIKGFNKEANYLTKRYSDGSYIGFEKTSKEELY